MNIDLVTLVVPDYDSAIEFFVTCLGFQLAEDTQSMSDAGQTKRWVVVRPKGGGTGLLLACADGDRQSEVIGNQTGGRVGFFIRVENFDRAYGEMMSAGVAFVGDARVEPYGKVAVFSDPWGNRWDLVGSSAP